MSSLIVDFIFIVIVCVIAHVKQTSKHRRVQICFIFHLFFYLLIVDCIYHGAATLPGITSQPSTLPGSAGRPVTLLGVGREASFLGLAGWPASLHLGQPVSLDLLAGKQPVLLVLTAGQTVSFEAKSRPASLLLASRSPWWRRLASQSPRYCRPASQCPCCC